MKNKTTAVAEISFSTVVGIVGIGLTAVDLYYRFKPTEKIVVYKPKSEPEEEQQKLIGME